MRILQVSLLLSFAVENVLYTKATRYFYATVSSLLDPILGKFAARVFPMIPWALEEVMA